MRGAVGFALLVFASSSVYAAELPARGFDAPPPALNLTAPDHVFVAGLQPDEALSGPARSAATVGSGCSAADRRFGSCTQPSGAPSGVLAGHAQATTSTGAGGMAGGVMALEGLAALLQKD